MSVRLKNQVSQNAFLEGNGARIAELAQRPGEKPGVRCKRKAVELVPILPNRLHTGSSYYRAKTCRKENSRWSTSRICAGSAIIFNFHKRHRAQY